MYCTINYLKNPVNGSGVWKCIVCGKDGNEDKIYIEVGQCRIPARFEPTFSGACCEHTLLFWPQLANLRLVSYYAMLPRPPCLVAGAFFISPCSDIFDRHFATFFGIENIPLSEGRPTFPLLCGRWCSSLSPPISISRTDIAASCMKISMTFTRTPTPRYKSWAWRTNPWLHAMMYVVVDVLLYQALKSFSPLLSSPVYFSNPHIFPWSF